MLEEEKNEAIKRYALGPASAAGTRMILSCAMWRYFAVFRLMVSRTTNKPHRLRRINGGRGWRLGKKLCRVVSSNGCGNDCHCQDRRNAASVGIHDGK